MTERTAYPIPPRPWSLMVRDLGMGVHGRFAIADATGAIILEDIKSQDMAEYIIDLANSYPEMQVKP